MIAAARGAQWAEGRARIAGRLAAHVVQRPAVPVGGGCDGCGGVGDHGGGIVCDGVALVVVDGHGNSTGAECLGPHHLEISSCAKPWQQVAMACGRAPAAVRKRPCNAYIHWGRSQLVGPASSVACLSRRRLAGRRGLAGLRPKRRGSSRWPSREMADLAHWTWTRDAAARAS